MCPIKNLRNSLAQYHIIIIIIIYKNYTNQ